MTIGIPQALSYHYYMPLWHAFFGDLNCKIVLSGQTDRKKLNAGIKVAPSETCLPLKCYVGHLLSLIEKTECIFVPRLVCLQTQPRINLGCPKMIGLPDMIRALAPAAKLLTIDIDLRLESEKTSYATLGQKLGFRERRAQQAYENGIRRSDQYRNEEAAQARPNANPNDSMRIGVLGHAYLLYDEFLNCGLMRKIREAGAAAINCHDLGDEIGHMPVGVKPLSWYFENNTLCAAKHFYDDSSISGIIYLCSFGCGAASITHEVIQSEIDGSHATHFLRIVLDEHTGEAGIATRIESFVDMINLKRTGRL